jgi:hypothetical protein
MKYFTLLLFISLLADTALAQEYVIKLNQDAKEDTALKKRSFYFDAVTDNRDQAGNKRIVGHFGKNNNTTVLLDSDPEAFFLDYLHKLYPQRKGDMPLTFSINSIECSSSGGMFSEAKVKIDFDIVNSSTNEAVSNLTVEKTRQPVMGGKTFGVLLEELISYCVSQVKTDKAAAH